MGGKSHTLGTTRRRSQFPIGDELIVDVRRRVDAHQSVYYARVVEFGGYTYAMGVCSTNGVHDP
jgi:hypothetical protein